MFAEPFELPEVLARLTARAVPLQPGGGHCRPVFEGVELAGVLARISKGAQWLAMIRYLDDHSALPRLIALLASSGDIATSGHRHRDLVRLAVWELLDTPVCRRCKGRRVIRIDARWLECTTCGGSGHHPVSDAHRARGIGMSRQAFAQAWAGRYQQILDGVRGRLDSWDDEIRAKLRAELGRPPAP